jgi:hypothetical protein
MAAANPPIPSPTIMILIPLDRGSAMAAGPWFDGIDGIVMMNGSE